MSNIKLEDLIKILKKNGLNADDDFSIQFVDEKKHKEKYDETRNFQIVNGKTLNVDLDENEDVLSLEIINI